MKLSDLSKMSEAERKTALDDLVEQSRQPADPEMIQDYKNRIAAYEEKFEITSEQMKKKLSLGEIQETWEICKWLLDLQMMKYFQ